MKKLVIIAALAVSSISAEAQWSIQNDNPCDIEYAVGCYNVASCEVTAAPGSISGYTGFTTVASNPGVPVALSNPCGSPDAPFWELRYVGSTSAIGEVIYISPNHWSEYNPCYHEVFQPWNHGAQFSLFGPVCNTSGTFWAGNTHIVP